MFFFFRYLLIRKLRVLVNTHPLHPSLINSLFVPSFLNPTTPFPPTPAPFLNPHRPPSPTSPPSNPSYSSSSSPPTLTFPLGPSFLIGILIPCVAKILLSAVLSITPGNFLALNTWKTSLKQDARTGALPLLREDWDCRDWDWDWGEGVERAAVG